MTSTQVIDVIVGIGVVTLVVVRQFKPRRAKENSSARLVLILALVGVIEIVSAKRGFSVSAATWTWILASLIVGAGLGALRGATVTIWRDQQGVAWRKGTAWTAALWVVSFGAHLALEVGINHSTKAVSLGASSLLLYLAVTLGVQRELIRWRASVIQLQTTSPLSHS